jgi:hypothetical protein
MATENDIRLLEAIWSGDSEAVRALLRNGANANYHGWYDRGPRSAKTPSDVPLQMLSWHPLSAAASLGHSDIVQMLLHHRADINLRVHGATALMKACEYGHAETVKLLLREGADYRIRNGLTSPLGQVAGGGRAAVVKVMLDHGVDVHDRYTRQDHADDNIREISDDPLRNAVAGGHEEVVGILLRAGADANQVDGYALDQALKRPDIMKLLGIPADFKIEIDDARTKQFRTEDKRIRESIERDELEGTEREARVSATSLPFRRQDQGNDRDLCERAALVSDIAVALNDDERDTEIRHIRESIERDRDGLPFRRHGQGSDPELRERAALPSAWRSPAPGLKPGG